jgi:hypothetical protein
MEVPLTIVCQRSTYSGQIYIELEPLVNALAHTAARCRGIGRTSFQEFLSSSNAPLVYRCNSSVYL